jgi:hypothetical protein
MKKASLVRVNFCSKNGEFPRFYVPISPSFYRFASPSAPVTVLYDSNLVLFFFYLVAVNAELVSKSVYRRCSEQRQHKGPTLSLLHTTVGSKKQEVQTRTNFQTRESHKAGP